MKKFLLTSIVQIVNKNVTTGIGLGKTKNVCSCTNPPVITAVLVLFNHPNCFKIKHIALSAPMYNAQAFAAQYACTKPLLNGNSLDIT